MNTLPTLPPVADMTFRDLLSELSAHGYTPDDLTEIKNWTQAAAWVERLRGIEI